jgi:hypothetical protein
LWLEAPARRNDPDQGHRRGKHGEAAAHERGGGIPILDNQAAHRAPLPRSCPTGLTSTLGCRARGTGEARTVPPGAPLALARPHARHHSGLAVPASGMPATSETGSTFLFCRNFASMSIHRNIEIEMMSIHRNIEIETMSIHRNIEIETMSIHRNIEIEGAKWFPLRWKLL